jgi:hypothetical protein
MEEKFREQRRIGHSIRKIVPQKKMLPPRILPPLNAAGEFDPEGIRNNVSKSVIIQGSMQEASLLKIEPMEDKEPEIKATENTVTEPSPEVNKNEDKAELPIN